MPQGKDAMSGVVTDTVAKLRGPDPQGSHEQLERVLHSQTFSNALTLQRLLRFIASKAAGNDHCELKEYTIGCELFGRGPDYDPKIDTGVRVEVHRLRQKLEEYYKSEGANDSILIDIPKGQYLPRFSPRIPPTGTVNGAVDASESPLPNPEERKPEGTKSGLRRQGRLAQKNRFFYGAVAAIVVFFLGSLAGARWPSWRNARDGAIVASQTPLPSAKGTNAMLDFWSAFLGTDATPVLGFPAATFLIDETNDLFRFRRGASDDRGAPVNHNLAQQFASNPPLLARAGPVFYENGYTGVGEAESIARLASLFAQMGRPLVVAPANEMTMKDFNEHNMILLGSSFQNKAVAQIPMSGDFVFDEPDPRQELWRGRILNLHPRPGESPIYKTERDPVTQVLRTDYALMAIEPGSEPGHLIAILAGLDTTGTAGACQFATSVSGIEALAKFFASPAGGAKPGLPTAFQAVLKVDLASGRDVRGVSLVAAHILGQTTTSHAVGISSR